MTGKKRKSRTEELYNRSRMSPSFTWSNGSMLLIPLLKSSWNTKLIRAPPDSSFIDKSSLPPSMAFRNSVENSLIIVRTTSPELPSPVAPPNDCNSALNFCWFWVIRALISGRLARMWCMRICKQNQYASMTAKQSTYHVELTSKEGCSTELSL